MREARIILPFVRMHPRNHEAHTGLKAALAETFGGYTVYKGQGGWKSQLTGKIEDEDIRIYDVAMVQGVNFNQDLLRIATAAGCLLDQHCVYLRYPGALVDIVAIECGQTALDTEHDRMADDGGPVPAPREDYSTGLPGIETLPSRPGGPAKRLPAINEIWDTACGARVAVVSQASVYGGGYNVIVLKNGSAAIKPGFVYLVDLDGLHGRTAHERGSMPLDLMRYHGHFAND